MSYIGKKIIETRKSKGLTQEELAELSAINLRTIQRIENNENEPRGKTLNLICKALEIDNSDLIENDKQNPINKISSIILNGFFLIILNLILMITLGFLTLESNANINSRIGAFIMSFFIPFFIVYWTPKMNGIERVLKYGFGFIVQIFTYLIASEFGPRLQTGLTTNFILPCLIISIGVLYYGKFLLRIKK